MERYIHLLLQIIFLMFCSTSTSQAEQFLNYPFSTNKDSIITNTFEGHDYCEATNCRGVDYGVSHGTALYASMSGTVTVVDIYPDQGDAQGCDDSNINYGNYVKITNGSWEVIYGHMANGQMQVSSGSTVEAGDLLGYSSNSGYTCGSGPNGSAYHLHLELEYNNIDKDPYAEDYFIIDYDGSYHYPIEEAPEVCTTTVYETRAILTDGNSGDKYYYSEFSEADAALIRHGSITYTGSGTVNNWFVGDVNGDGYDDVIMAVNTADNTERRYIVYTSDWDGTFTNEGSWLTLARVDVDKTFIADFNNDGAKDIIIGKEKNDGSWRWKVWSSTGNAFTSEQTWAEDYGKWHDIFVITDLTRDGTADLLRGREADGSTQGGDGNCSSKLIWKRLKANGDTSTVVGNDDLWGYSAAQYMAGNIDYNGDGKEDILQIQMCSNDNDVEAYVRHFNSSSGKLESGVSNTNTTAKLANDVGGTDGLYALADLNNDNYPDLIRWSSTNLKWMQNISGTSFQEGANADTLIADAGYTSGTQRLLLGYFGEYEVESCRSPNGIDSPENIDLHDLVHAHLMDTISSPFITYSEINQRFWAYYQDVDGDIYEFGSPNGVNWSGTNLSDHIGFYETASSGTTPVLAINETTEHSYLVYMGSDDRIKVMDSDSTSWTAFDLFDLVRTGWADASTSPWAYVSPITNNTHIVYTGSDQRLYEITHNGSSWTSEYISDIVRHDYIQAGTSPHAVTDPISGDRYIAFTGYSGNTNLLKHNYVTETWSRWSLTDEGAPTTDLTTSPYLYVDDVDGSLYILLTDNSGRLNQVHFDGFTWTTVDLMDYIAVDTVAQYTRSTSFVDPNTGTHYISYTGDNSELYQFMIQSNGTISGGQINTDTSIATETSVWSLADTYTNLHYTVYTGSDGRFQLYVF
ncbi:MAG: FG-GAP-like repeat-containing protein [bacterium]|nr:FG-GAP-like repeat-containing protein [bacterium]